MKQIAKYFIVVVVLFAGIPELSFAEERLLCKVNGSGTVPAGDRGVGEIRQRDDLSVSGVWIHDTAERINLKCFKEKHAFASHGRCRCRNPDTQHYDMYGKKTNKHCKCRKQCDPVIRDRVIGRPDFMFCRPNGSFLVDFSGPATFNGKSGFTFGVAIQDREHPAGPDTYTLVIHDSDLNVVHSIVDNLIFGNFQSEYTP